MKGKKTTTVSKKGRKRALKENVQASTSLPPEVEGQLRCYLRVSVTKIVWTISNHPDVVHVRLRWWGELSNGTVYRPSDVKNPKKSAVRSIARFPVRCGPKQFAAYLNDMGTIIFEVLRGQTMTPMGKAQINEIGHLTPTRPINGFFTVFSNKNAEKIAELQVSLVFEPLPATYESSSSIPTTDVSMMPREERRQSEVSLVSKRKNVPKPEPRNFHYSASSDDPFLSPKKETKVSETRADSARHTPRGIDSDYSFVIGPGFAADNQSNNKDTASDVSKIDKQFAQYKSRQVKRDHLESSVSGTDADKPATGRHIPLSVSDMDAGNKHPAMRLDPRNGAGSDVITNLLQRGTQLRNDMIQAELDSWNEQAHLISKPQEDYSDRNRPRSGELLQEILQVDTTSKTNQVSNSIKGQDILNLNSDEESSQLNDLETRTVELVLGDKFPREKFKVLQKFQDDVSVVSLSSNSDEDVMSDLSDPVHDEAILEELFYKHPGSSSSDGLSDLLSSDDEMPDRNTSRSISIDDPGNIRPPSRKSSRNSSRRESCSTQLDTEKEPNAGQRLQSLNDNNGIDDNDDDTQSLSARSEGSRVSFDDLIQEPTERQGSDVIEGLSVERLTLLGRVNVARVSVDDMTLNDVTPAQAATPSSTSKGHKVKSRPPRPTQKLRRKKTYLVEYKFPVVASSRDGGSKVTTATEVMRLASKKVKESDVSFTHRSVFPVRFDEMAVNRWWNHLLVFKVFARTAGQRTPDMLGVASIPLRSVLESPALNLQVGIPVRDKTEKKQDTSRWSGSDEKIDKDDGKTIGHLQISVELASDSKDFKFDMAKVNVAEMKGSQVVALPSHKEPTQTIPIPKNQPDKKKVTSDTQIRYNNIPRKKDSSPVSKKDVAPDDGRVEEKSGEPQQEDILVKEFKHGVTSDQKTPVRMQSELMTLHCLLHIPCGRGLNLQGIPPTSLDTKPQSHPKPHPGTGVGIASFGRDNITRNTYLICRMFSSDDAVKSNVCWGTTEPNYDFLQIAPVLVTSALLERTRNNFIIIEVWDKKTSAENDQLVGIVKVPVHQFYMSFRDSRISNVLLRSKFPVVAVDNYLPIVNPLTGTRYGELKVLLSLGSQGQISEIQRVKLDSVASVPLADRPEHFLERADGLTSDDASGTNKMREHVFEVIVEGIRGFPQFQDTVWGEADCFVQYHFPTCPQQGQHAPDQPIKHPTPTLKPHRTATTLCIPDPMFHDICRHRLNIPGNTPVQRELLTACAGVGGGAGGIPFEVWCRYYYPNIRDQVLAKATLPLAKLCAMVTMQKRGETSVQSFSLPLRPQLQEDEPQDVEQRAKSLNIYISVLLDITINYKTSVMKDQAQHGLTKPIGSQVCIAVGIIRACGLKAAAKSVAKHDAGMQYPGDVGVNCYVKMILSFLSKDAIRVTQTVARNFAPEFSHYVDFPCPLRFSEDSAVGGMSLAEMLETGDITFQVWHQVPGFKPDLDVKVFETGTAGKSVTARRLFTSSGDILLGSCTIPLRRLITSKTGIKGWYPLYVPPLGWDSSKAKQPLLQQEQERAGSMHCPTDRVGGGLEVLINLAHQHDRERVIHAAHTLGWAPDESLHDVEEHQQHDSDHVMMTSDLEVHVDIAVFPSSCALRAGQTQVDQQAKAYIRYKFYDKAAVVSKLTYLDDQDSEYIQADLQHAHRFRCHSTEPFHWYLREERLEIQLWLSYSDTTTSETRPRQRDKLIGCSYLDLSPLSRGFRDTQRVSGMYPVFKPGAAYLGGAFLRVHITRKQMRKHQHDFIDDEGSIPDEDVGDISRERQRLWNIPDEDDVYITRKRQQLWKLQQKEEHEEQERLQKEEAARLADIEKERQRMEEEEKWKRRPVRVHVVVEQAMHVACNPGVNGLNRFYVSYQTTDGSVKSPSVSGCDRIIWGFENEAKVNRDVLENQNLIFKIWQQTSEEPSTASDRVLGFVSVDLCPLLAGFKLINGWYNIMDFSGQCQGQLKIAISPLESISPLKQPTESQRGNTTSPKNVSTIFTSSSQYAEFPSHLVQYTEQAIQSHNSEPINPNVDKDERQNSRLQSHGQSHFEQHLRNVRQFHENLQQRLSYLNGGGMSGPESKHQPSPHIGVFEPDTATSFMMNSKSFLRRNLKTNLQQLDIIQENLRKKLEKKDHTQLMATELERRDDTHLMPTEPESRDYTKLTATSRVPNVEDDNQRIDTTNFDQGSGANVGNIADTFPDDRLINVAEDYRVLERDKPERLSADEMMTENEDASLRMLPIGAEGLIHSAVRHPIGAGSLVDVEPQIRDSSHKDLSENFEQDLEGIITPPLDVKYGTHENIEDLLPPRPPPAHWDPPRQESDSDWEDSLNFKDIGSDVEEVIPRPLNDISSPEFSNGIVPDASADSPNVQQSVEQRQQLQCIQKENPDGDHQEDFGSRIPEDVNQDTTMPDSIEHEVALQENLTFKEDPATIENDGQSLERDSSFIVLCTDTKTKPDHIQAFDTNNHQDHPNGQIIERPEPNLEDSTKDHKANNYCREMVSDVRDSDEDSVVITMNPEEAVAQKDHFEEKLKIEDKAKVLQKPVVVPNFFLPPDDLEASMRALRTAASVLPPRQQPASTSQLQSAQRRDQHFSPMRAAAVKEVADRLHRPRTHISQPRPKIQARPPTAEEAKRIARIFSAKYSTS
ncbi:C2 domain-containing protein 3-like [Anneissia japonica]|uniref:C2 domain-containing protein 3-like n=1 Tax=Anneissia japonica TaxID=1529436 RepID=UPI00142551D2|nr:C2 domain-containing protein 3-like [Anneissia japonica]